MDVQRIARLLERGEDDLTIRGVILDYAQKNKQIIYGSRGFNLQAPTILRKKTSDYDLLAKKPKKSAHEVAKILRRRLKREVTVKKAVHKGTWKVLIDDEPVIDYTQIKRKPKTKKVWGLKVKDIKAVKKNVRRLIKKPETKFRREKDIDVLDRIKQIEMMEEGFL